MIEGINKVSKGGDVEIDRGHKKGIRKLTASSLKDSS